MMSFRCLFVLIFNISFLTDQWSCRSWLKIKRKDGLRLVRRFRVSRSIQSGCIKNIKLSGGTVFSGRVTIRIPWLHKQDQVVLFDKAWGHFTSTYTFTECHKETPRWKQFVKDFRSMSILRNYFITPDYVGLLS